MRAIFHLHRSMHPGAVLVLQRCGWMLQMRRKWIELEISAGCVWGGKLGGLVLVRNSLIHRKRTGVIASMD